MAHHLSAKKRIRQNIKRSERNRSLRTFMRGKLKKLRLLVDEGKKDEAKAFLPEIISAIERLGTKGVIHSRQVSRRVSRVVRAVNNID